MNEIEKQKKNSDLSLGVTTDLSRSCLSHLISESQIKEKIREMKEILIEETEFSVPLIIIKDIAGLDFTWSIGYLPKNNTDEALIDKENDIPKFSKYIEELGQKHTWGENIIRLVAREIKRVYAPRALYLVMKFHASFKYPETRIALVDGEMIKDWDLRLEALKLMGE